MRFHCNACQRDITDGVRIRCAECVDFDMCCNCFASGIEVLPHKKTHSYRVMRSLAYPIFTPDWGADEELLLLEGIDLFGMGNWHDIADHVVTKSKVECERHYLEIYMHSSTSPIPVSKNME